MIMIMIMIMIAIRTSAGLPVAEGWSELSSLDASNPEKLRAQSLIAVYARDARYNATRNINTPCVGLISG